MILIFSSGRVKTTDNCSAKLCNISKVQFMQSLTFGRKTVLVLLLLWGTGQLYPDTCYFTLLMLVIRSLFN